MNIKLAIAIEDLHRAPANMRDKISLVCDLLNPISHVGEARNEAIPAVEFICDTLEAAMIVDILRQRDVTAEREPTRVYVRAERIGATWRKVPGHEQLTLMINDEVMLNRAALDVPEDTISAAREEAEAMPLKRTTLPVQPMNQHHRPRIVS